MTRENIENNKKENNLKDININQKEEKSKKEEVKLTYFIGLLVLLIVVNMLISLLALSKGMFINKQNNITHKAIVEGYNSKITELSNNINNLNKKIDKINNIIKNEKYREIDEILNNDEYTNYIKNKLNIE